MADNNLSDMITASLQSIKDFAGTETIIGDPMLLPNGSTVIPVSKIVMGFASGGFDHDKKSESLGRGKAFTGGGGTGVSILPIAFLVADPGGKTDLLPVITPKKPDTVDKIASLIERSPEILGDLKDVLTSEKNRERPRNARQDPKNNNTAG